MAAKENVFVALSGGVDSAVAAARLLEQGYDVTGVFIKIWQPEFLECTWREDRLDAMRVAAALGIPFREVDLSEEYKQAVVDDMLAKYQVGLTPNPDVLCNRHIKFGALWEWAQQRGANYIATGHHARVKGDARNSKSEIRSTKEQYQLLRGVDPTKDQAYFLWQLTQEDLAHTLLPVGDMEKSAVRKRAKVLQLAVAEKPDSQGLCFVGDIDMPTFLARFITVTPGDIYDRGGNRIGQHAGAALYTLGQRRGLEITKRAENTTPHYVVGIDVSNNIIVASEDPEDAARTHITLTAVNWIADAPPRHTPLSTEVRYHQKSQQCTLVRQEGAWQIQFSAPQIVAPGQSIVLYDGEQCLGGGIAQTAACASCV